MTAGSVLGQGVRALGLMALCLGLAACVPATTGPTLNPAPPAPAPVATPARVQSPALTSPAAAAQAFVSVVNRVEPLAEAQCRQQAPLGTRCDFDIGVDPRPNLPPNAFQTLDASGRPVIIFTLSLIAMARNADELAFVLSHEAAHHIAGHIPRRMQTAEQGALMGAILGQVAGVDAATMQEMQRAGAMLGARQYSKEFEYEADALGARIAWAAGYDPVRGTGFFDRLPDPGDRFLGSHPPNGQRKAQVRAIVASLASSS